MTMNKHDKKLLDEFFKATERWAKARHADYNVPGIRLLFGNKVY